MKLLNQIVPPHTVHAQHVSGVVFDLAGTTVDYGSLAPTRTLQRLFASLGVPLAEEEARKDMGLAKRDHIARIFSLPRVREQWRQVHGAPPVEEDVTRAYEEFIPLQLECLGEYSTVIDGVPDLVERLRSRDLRIGSSTGYTRAMLDFLLSCTARQGFLPEVSLSPEDVNAGRPHPFMIFEIAVRLHIDPLAAIVKVGDTPADIQEGLNAGVWSIGVAKTGNMIGLSKTDLEGLPKADVAVRLSTARKELEAAGAHYVIDTLGELEGVLDDINTRLQSTALSR